MLADFIADTGITKIRDARNEEEEKKTSKQRQRDKMQPKMGKINIDYQILHDAFFKFQTKPKLTRHGDIYYEGKEFELQLQHKKPGHLSEALKQALGMPEGAPPPWLINMQRYGPPPAYPKLKIPGLNAPIPEGASFGYHPGGWGRPPVDEQGRPLYGDVFGTEKEEEKEVVDKTRWGVITPEESEEESEDESGDDDEEDEDEQDDAPDAGMATPMDGVATMASGLTTPATIDLRKGLRKYVERCPCRCDCVGVSHSHTRACVVCLVGCRVAGGWRRPKLPNFTKCSKPNRYVDCETVMHCSTVCSHVCDPSAGQGWLWNPHGQLAPVCAPGARCRCRGHRLNGVGRVGRQDTASQVPGNRRRGSHRDVRCRGGVAEEAQAQGGKGCGEEQALARQVQVLGVAVAVAYILRNTRVSLLRIHYCFTMVTVA